MPYKSDAQRKKMHADPKLRPIAEKWDEEYGSKIDKAAKSRQPRTALKRVRITKSKKKAPAKKE